MWTCIADFLGGVPFHFQDINWWSTWNYLVFHQRKSPPWDCVRFGSRHLLYYKVQRLFHMWESHLLQFWTTGSGPVWICPRRSSSGSHSPSTPQLLDNRPRWCQAWITSQGWTLNQSYLGQEFGVDCSVFQAPGYRAPGVLLGIQQLTELVKLLNIYGNIILIIIVTEGEEEYDERSQTIQCCGWPSDDLLEEYLLQRGIYNRNGESGPVTFHRSESWRRKTCPWTCWKGHSRSRMIGLKLQWSCSEVFIGPQRHIEIYCIHPLGKLNCSSSIYKVKKQI